ncbi:MAG: glycosyltransferase family 4 protein [Bacilli bacterium]|nr:glycosyltransferase family 4 protein [Bacilli bacterium]
MNKLLIISVFAAPYRSKIFDYFKSKYSLDIFYERDSDYGRNKDWFLDCSNVLNNKKYLKIFKRCMRNIECYKAVILYDFTSIHSIKAILRCKIKKVPYFINCDGVILTKKKNLFFRLIKKFLLHNVTGCFASGVYAKNYFVDLNVPSDKIFIHNFTTLESNDILKTVNHSVSKDYLRLKFNIQKQSYIYLGVGRFIALKNYFWLIKNWPNDNKHYLILIGGGEEQTKYTEYIKSHDLRNIIIQDYLPFEQIKKYYQGADFFIHPTTYDSWGLVINEALSNGCPVISSNKCIAALELIKNNYNGFVVDFDKIDINYIFNLFENYNPSKMKLLRNNCLNSIKEFTIKNMALTQINAIERSIK